MTAGTYTNLLILWYTSVADTVPFRISAVPEFPGLRRFPDGRDFSQWTGDDSKALMKVHIFVHVCSLA